MGYQSGRRYGGDERFSGDRFSRNRYVTDGDRGQDRYRGVGGDRDDGAYRYGTRGQFGGGADYRREPPGYDADERGFLDRAGDEVRSWFGDEEAERRRDYDDYVNRYYDDPRDRTNPYGYGANRDNRPRTYGPKADLGSHHDSNYHSWRQQRIDELDRDYADYQRENRERFNSEFGTWRTRRSEQRQALGQVREHMDVVGSDGDHVGTVDKLHGDRIILTKSDSDAGGVHHSIPSAWIKSVDAQRVTLEKTADQAQHAWRAEREQQALFGDREADGATTPRGASVGGSRYR
jgi:hypothetical protein